MALGLLPWGVYLRPYSVEGLLLLGVALVIALAATGLLVAVRAPMWLVAITLPVNLILCSSAATLLLVVLGVDGAAWIHPLNGYTVVFGGVWALFALLARAVTAAVGRAAALHGPRS